MEYHEFANSFEEYYYDETDGVLNARWHYKDYRQDCDSIDEILGNVINKLTSNDYPKLIEYMLKIGINEFAFDYIFRRGIDPTKFVFNGKSFYGIIVRYLHHESFNIIQHYIRNFSIGSKELIESQDVLMELFDNEMSQFILELWDHLNINDNTCSIVNKEGKTCIDMHIQHGNKYGNRKYNNPYPFFLFLIKKGITKIIINDNSKQMLHNYFNDTYSSERLLSPTKLLNLLIGNNVNIDYEYILKDNYLLGQYLQIIQLKRKVYELEMALLYSPDNIDNNEELKAVKERHDDKQLELKIIKIIQSLSNK